MKDSRSQARIDSLTERMAELGAPDPGSWARSEVREDIAQEARYLFLRGLWPEIDSQHKGVDKLPAAVRAMHAGAAREDVITIARAAAYEAIFAVLYRLSAGDEDAPAGAPGWSLEETRDEDSGTFLTGRQVGSLYEDLLSLDPSGREGLDLWQ